MDYSEATSEFAKLTYHVSKINAHIQESKLVLENLGLSVHTMDVLSSLLEKQYYEAKYKFHEIESQALRGEE